MNEVEQAQAELDSLKSEWTYLQQERKHLEDTLKEIEARSKELHNIWLADGLIYQAERRLAKAQLKAEDENARLVVWKAGQPHWTRDRQYVVSKVTPKRIYIRAKGNDRAEFYGRDGIKPNRPVTSYGQIDIEATFPEGIEEFAKANK